MSNDLFSSLPIFNEAQLKVASKDQLISLFNQLSSIKQSMEKKSLDQRVLLETKQNEHKKLSEEIQEKFQTSSIEELETLKQVKISELAKLGEELGVLVNKDTGENNG